MIAWLFKRPERQPQPARLNKTLEGITLEDLKRSARRSILAKRQATVTAALRNGLAYGITSPIPPRDVVVKAEREAHLHRNAAAGHGARPPLTHAPKE
ncbi:MAG: hypothetical protein ABIS14_11465 [Sphingomonas sp.]